MTVEPRALPEFPGYMVHAEGYIVSTKYREPRRLKADWTGGQKLYQKVSLMRGRKVEKHYVAHLVMGAFGPPRPSPEARIEFHDRDPANCAIGNLYWTGGA